MGSGMTAAQAAQQDNRDQAGRYAEQPHADPGAAILPGTVDFAAGDPNRLLNDAQRAVVEQLAPLVGRQQLVVSTSCAGHRYATLGSAEGQPDPGIITSVSVEFYADQPKPNVVTAVSGWTWPETIDCYSSNSVHADLTLEQAADHDRVRADLAELARIQQLLDERINKPSLRLLAGAGRGRYVTANLHDANGSTWLNVDIGGETARFQVADRRIEVAFVHTNLWSDIRLHDDEHVADIVSRLGRELSISLPDSGSDGLPDWRQGLPDRAAVERFLFSEGTPD